MNLTDLLNTTVGRKMIRDAEAEDLRTREARRQELIREIAKARAADDAQAKPQRRAIDAAAAKLDAAKGALRKAELDLQRAIGERSRMSNEAARAVELREAELREIAPPAVAAFDRECFRALEDLPTLIAHGAAVSRLGDLTTEFTNAGAIQDAMAEVRRLRREGAALPLEPLTDAQILERIEVLRERLRQVRVGDLAPAGASGK